MMQRSQTTQLAPTTPFNFRARFRLGLFALAMLGLALPAAATITPFFSMGTTCAGGTAANYQTNGPAIKVSLCVTTTDNVTERLCGHTIKLQTANAGENSRFGIANRVLGPNYPDPNNVVITYPVVISNPAATRDFGGTTASGLPYPAEASQLLATFDVKPQALATNAAYVISTSGDSILAVDTDGTCGNASDYFIPASFNLNLVASPAFASAASTLFTVNSANTFTVSAGGTPIPTLSLVSGSLPSGVTFMQATGALSGTPALGTVGSYPLNFAAANGTLPDAAQSFTLTITTKVQTITFGNPGAACHWRPPRIAVSRLVLPLSRAASVQSPVIPRRC